MSTQWFVSFQDASAMLRAAQALRQEGVWYIEAITPYPVIGVDDFLSPSHSERPLAASALTGALLGLLTGYAMQWHGSVRDMPLNVGGRPLDSWPAFIPIMFILMILGAGLFIVTAFVIRLRLPWLAHPLFRLASFDLSRDVFGLMVRVIQDEDGFRRRLRALGAIAIEEIP